MKCPHCNKEIETEYQTIKHKGKEFRIYKWEDKPFKDFKIPKGFDWAEYFDVVELANKDKLEFTKPFKEIYICKTQFKRNLKSKWSLSRLFLSDDLSLYSYDSILDDSNDYGRVVVCRVKKEKCGAKFNLEGMKVMIFDGDKKEK